MNKDERKIRDARIIKLYENDFSAERIASMTGVKPSTVYAITARANVKRWTKRGPKRIAEIPESLTLEPDAYLLVARKGCKTLARAQYWLNRAAFLDAHPGTPLVTMRDMGINKTKFKLAMHQLLKINATINTVAPFKIVFNDAAKYLDLTHRQLVLFLAHPYMYLLEHKDDIKPIAGLPREEA